MQKVKWINFFISFIWIFLVISCSKKSDKALSFEDSSNTKTFFAVSVDTVQKGQIQDYLDINGEVISNVSVEVFSDNSGKITRYLKSLGQSVRENEIIGYVDPSRPGSRFALSPIKAPISGTLTSLPYKVGSTVTMQNSLARISQLDKLEIVTYVAERFFSRIKIGQQALIKFDAYPGIDFEGKVSEISPFIDSSKRTLELRIKLNSAKQREMIEMGMFAEIKLITESKQNVVKIPSSAVVRRSNKSSVFVVKDASTSESISKEEGKTLLKDLNNDTEETQYKVQQRDITEGIVIDGYSEILEGLKAGEVIVIQGQNSLGDGSFVKIVGEESPFINESEEPSSSSL